MVRCKAVPTHGEPGSLSIGRGQGRGGARERRQGDDQWHRELFRERKRRAGQESGYGGRRSSMEMATTGWRQL